MLANETAPIRVLIVDDSRLTLTMLGRILDADPDIEVIGKIEDGAEALELVSKLKPDVVCTDLKMPGMDGLELTKEILKIAQIPILVISSSFESNSATSSPETFALLAAGAVDLLAKPKGGFDVMHEESEALRKRVKLVSKIKVFKRHSSYFREERVSAFSQSRDHDVIAIGASTGGPQALMKILPGLPDYFPPILCTQHISRGFSDPLARWLDGLTRVKVRIAKSGERILPGHVYIAQEDTHLTLNYGGILRCSASALPVNGHRPSVDPMFSSVAKVAGRKAVGVLLSGMGIDGAHGLLEMKKSGATTIAQAQSSCVVFGMPGEAVRLNAVDQVLSAEEIAAALLRLTPANVISR